MLREGMARVLCRAIAMVVFGLCVGSLGLRESWISSEEMREGWETRGLRLFLGFDCLAFEFAFDERIE